MGSPRAGQREARDRLGGQAMKRLRRASVIATLGLLAWSATAYAECAWVLWMTIGSGYTAVSDVSRLTAFKTSRECEIAIAQMVNSRLKMAEPP